MNSTMLYAMRYDKNDQIIKKNRLDGYAKYSFEELY